jgi:hypothetical protein
MLILIYHTKPMRFLVLNHMSLCNQEIHSSSSNETIGRMINEFFKMIKTKLLFSLLNYRHQVFRYHLQPLKNQFHQLRFLITRTLICSAFSSKKLSQVSILLSKLIKSSTERSGKIVLNEELKFSQTE